MRRLLLIALLSVACSTFAAAISIPEAGRTILTTGEWTPTQAQAQRAFARVQIFLQKQNGLDGSGKKAIAQIKSKKSGYRVQFSGSRKGGKEIVVCNFFPAKNSAGVDSFSYWKQRQVAVFDGGADFWRIEYDPAADTCGNFQWNGDA
ncbi:MAG TPA: hypothetical protein VF593_10540 [Chthoniobacteraceae bacterium]|jgi:hypothetical protein